MAWQEEWNVPRRARECAVTGEAFAAGDRVVSELIEGPDGFERRDRLEGSPEGDVRPYSRWTSVWPPEPEQTPGVDLDLARRFLRDLLAEGDEARRPLAHVLTLLLVRKRRLKVLDRGLAPDGTAVMRVCAPDDPDDVQEVPTPPMTAEIVAAVSAEVAELFGFGPPEPAEGEAAQGAEGGPEDAGGEGEDAPSVLS